MPARIPYHHPFDKNYSLDYANPNKGNVSERMKRYGSGTKTRIEQCHIDETVHLLYSESNVEESAEDIDYEATQILKETSRANSVIATRILGLFESILETNQEEEDEKVQAYKVLDPEKLPKALDQTDWNGTAAEVAGRLASNLVLKHALPNANHRTSIATIQFYLRRIEQSFEMPRTSTATYDWMTWVDEYIVESKCLSTVRRKIHLFKHLQQFGADVIERKDGIDIRLDNYELDLPYSDSQKIYAIRHEQLWIDFVQTALMRADAARLITHPALSKHRFADEIRQLA